MNGKELKMLKERVRVYGRKKMSVVIRVKPGTLGAYLTGWLTFPDKVIDSINKALDAKEMAQCKRDI